MKIFTYSFCQLTSMSIRSLCRSNLRAITVSSLHSSSIHRESGRKIKINVVENSKADVEAHTTIQREVEKFNSMGENWWDLNGDCMPLHSMNKLRVQLIRNGLLHAKQIKDENVNGPHMLKGLKILDVGCGGGILSEPLARLGGDVVGIDAGEKNIEIAESHAANDSSIANRLRYIHSTVEDHCQNVSETYDAVVASDVLEHVDNVSVFVEKCIQCLKPGGSLFVTTINKTKRSYWAGIIIAERLLKLLPNGTHDWDLFVPLEDLRQKIDQGGCSVRLVHGMFYIPVRNEWVWIADSSVNYAVHAVKL